MTCAASSPSATPCAMEDRCMIYFDLRCNWFEATGQNISPISKDGRIRTIGTPKFDAAPRIKVDAAGPRAVGLLPRSVQQC